MALPLQILPAKSVTCIPSVPENPKKLLLEQCKTIKDLKQLHAYLIKTRRLHDPATAEPLLESAALLVHRPDVDYAASIFRKLENPEASAYNVMIRAFTSERSPEKSLILFRQMVEHLVYPDEFTFCGALKACSKIRALKEGKQIHALIVKRKDEFGRREIVENGLVYMYGSCEEVKLAGKVFDEMPERSSFSWNSIFAGYVNCGYWGEVVKLFREMVEIGNGFDRVTLITVLKACGRVGDLELGEWIFGYVVRNGLMGNDDSLATSIIDMYARCGRVAIARKVFDEMPKRDAVAWSVMIAGYSRSSSCKEALDLFYAMQDENVEPQEVTMVSVLSACGVLGAFETGKWVHAYVKKRGVNVTVSLGTALLDFYAKCGCVDRAIKVFEGMKVKNVWTWTALIQGLASNGQGKSAIDYFELMHRENMKPNEVTFVGVLSACNHAGMVEEGKYYFVRMSRDFGIEPRIEHYGCMVDLLARAGLVHEAYELLKSTPIKPNALMWRMLLASCRLHKQVDIGEEAVKHVVRLDPLHSGDYILLSNLYASVGRLKDAKRLRNEMKRLGIKKSPGWSYIEVDGMVHEFFAEDRRHPESISIYKAIEDMMEQIKLGGYVPDLTHARLEAEEDDDREASVSHHSEKLAIAYGLIRTNPGTPIRVTKNLRICTDCHSAAKVISKVYNREIVVRDRNRFHHFIDGSCSCNNFW